MALPEESFRSYKEFHEHFMQNHNGTTLVETAVLLSPPTVAVLLWSVALPAIRGTCEKGYNSVGVFVSEFLILVFPLVFTYTVLSDYVLVVSAMMLIAWMLLVIRTMHWKLVRKRCVSWLEIVVVDKRRPFITLFRSYMNVVTCLSILAVDFQVFPRKFAKTEVGGYGWMDAGTGIFVIANALVPCKTDYGKGTFTLTKAIKSSAPLLVLGSGRYFALSLLDYQTHVSEYGSHWNFFLTLAVTRVVGEALSSVFGNGSSLRVAAQFITISVAHEFALSVFGLREWVISDKTPRQGFVSSNREGLVSLVGYLALHTAGTLISLRIWRVPRHQVERWLELWMELASASLVAWVITHSLHGVTGVSRRVADLGYIFWILAYSLTGLVLFLGVELLISAIRHCSSSPKKELKGMTKAGIEQDSVVPGILQAVNQNGLAFFLLGNLMTGVVNLSLQTLHASTVHSIAILTLYMLTICGLAKLVYDKEIKLKLW